MNTQDEALKITEMQEAVRRLASLLESPEPGLFSWHEAVRRQWERTKVAFGERGSDTTATTFFPTYTTALHNRPYREHSPL